MDMPVGLRDGTINRGSADGARISAVADTGAQSDLWSLEEFLACGFARFRAQHGFVSHVIKTIREKDDGEQRGSERAEGLSLRGGPGLREEDQA
ncbi:hypothetical protein NQZ68_012830 [Dissostichus eleginoides]|nr:hypothetical protein NQZ68_012830 [Dissostichus eleginoides]